MRNHLGETRPSSRSELAAWYESALAEQERSGLSVADYADEIGVTAATLYGWRRRLQSPLRRSRTEGAGLVRVQIQPDASSPGVPSRALVIRVGRGRSIDVPPSFDASELARVIEVLESC